MNGHNYVQRRENAFSLKFPHNLYYADRYSLKHKLSAVDIWRILANDYVYESYTSKVSSPGKEVKQK